MGTPHGLSLAERFWMKVDRSAGPDACWPWTAHIKRNGYGAFGSGGKYGKVLMAHRVAYQLTHGVVAPDVHVDHMCRRRDCVNPAHLQAATRSENNQNRDRLKSVRSRSGVTNVNWCGSCGKWVVRMNVGGKRHSGGHFEAVEDAAVAAKALRLKLMTNNLQDRDSA